MKFIHKLGYYLGGFAIGIIILMFFLSGKKASCDYGPNARTVKHLAGLKKVYSEDAKSALKIHELDTLTIKNIIRYGEVDFSQSETRTKPCKSYTIDNTYKEKPVQIKLKNCDSLVTILQIKYN